MVAGLTKRMNVSGTVCDCDETSQVQLCGELDSRVWKSYLDGLECLVKAIKARGNVQAFSQTQDLVRNAIKVLLYR